MMSDTKDSQQDSQGLFNAVHGTAPVDDSTSTRSLFSWTGEDREKAEGMLFDHPDFSRLSETALSHPDKAKQQEARDKIKEIYREILQDI